MAAPARRSTAEEDRASPEAAAPRRSGAGLNAAEEAVVRRCLSPAARTLVAGTAGGRLDAALAARGFADLSAVDPDPARGAAAARLPFPDGHFDQALYLGELVCLLPSAADRALAVAEARRVTRPGGVAVFAFLSHDTRMKGVSARLHGYWLGAVRRLQGRPADPQRRPWPGSARGPGALLDRRPHAYWWRTDEAARLLRRSGLAIEGAGSAAQLERGELLDAPEQLDAGTAAGPLYLVCTAI
jgi:SAM-dependent methyltransferase